MPVLAENFLVEGRRDEPRIGVALHERVDLILGLVERVRRRSHHVVVDDFANTRVQANLLGTEDRDEVFVDDARFFFDFLRVSLSFQFFAGLPKQNVLQKSCQLPYTVRLSSSLPRPSIRL